MRIWAHLRRLEPWSRTPRLAGPDRRSPLVVINKAFEIVDRALDLTGGAGAFKRNRLEQIFRDLRMGRFHPGNTLLAHEPIGKLCLGVDPDSPQRWG